MQGAILCRDGVCGLEKQAIDVGGSYLKNFWVDCVSLSQRSRRPGAGTTWTSWNRHPRA